MSKFSTPDYDQACESFRAFLKTINQLRNPNGGCPWDLKQSIASLRPYMLEEAYEAVEAMSRGERDDIVEELGDVLLQVVLNAQVGCELHDFEIKDVIDAINNKIWERHPHVFSGLEGIDTEEKVKENWQKLKEQSKGVSIDPFKDAKDMGKNYPAVQQSHKIGKISAKVQFDWPDLASVFSQFESEVKELAIELNAKKIDKAAATEEVGDVFFSLVQVCRHMGIDPELTIFDANQKFLGRFDKMMALAERRGVDFSKLSLDEKEKLWQDIKSYTQA